MSMILPEGGYRPAPKPDQALPRGGRRMRRESPERAKQMAVYRHRRVLFLAQHPVCESPWPCGERSTTIQHRAGRRGDRLLDERWWASSCLDCNVIRAEQTDTADAYATNWKISPDFDGDPSEKPIIPIPTGVTA